MAHRSDLAHDYWAPLCDLAQRLKCWSRTRLVHGSKQWTTDWGMLLTMPTESYLEVSEGPFPLRQFQLVELATKRVRGGLAHRPLGFVDITAELLAELARCERAYELRDGTWSLSGLFSEAALVMVRLPNPFFEADSSPSS